MKKVSLYTLGCRVNQYESSAFSAELASRGYSVVKEPDKSTVCIVNTCAVTNEAVRQAGQLIRRIAAASAGVIVTGCAAQLCPEMFAKIGGVRYVCGNNAKMQVCDALERESEKTAVSVEPLDGAEYEYMPPIVSSRARAFIKIEDGCNGRCSYCAIRNARGPVRSRSADDAFAEISSLTCPEITLTGIELAAYSDDLCGLTERISGLENIRRIRFGSLDPAFLTPALTERLLGTDKVMPHLHISLQSGSDRVLGAMRRKYSAKTALENLEYIKKNFPEFLFSADVIVGFPGESGEDFSETLDFCERIGFLHIHRFPFSPRAGTEAAEMKGQVEKQVKKERMKRLGELEKRSRSGILSSLTGKENEVLFEEESGGRVTGHTRSFVTLSAPEGCAVPGEIKRVTPNRQDGEMLIAD